MRWRLSGWLGQARCRAALAALAGTLAVPLVLAQPAVATAPAGSDPVVVAHEGLGVEQQARLLSRQMATGEVEKLGDEQVLALIQALRPQTLLAWARAEMNRHPEYEYWMSRQERINGQWQARPARMQVRYRHAPRQLYARWLPGGTGAGQEIIYDETQRPQQMYAHLGGLLGFASMWVAIDGPAARTQSNHTVRDLGLQYIVELLEQNARGLRALGRDERPTQAEVVREQGQRLLALSWEMPAGPPQFYAKKVQLLFDLQRPWPRELRVWAEPGELRERMVIEKLTPRAFEPSVLDPKNPDYKF